MTAVKSANRYIFDRKLETYELAAEGGAWRVARATAVESIYCFPGFPLFLQCLDTDFVP